MNHAITVGGMLLGIGVIVGFVLLAFGALMTFAGMMSDAGDDGTSSQGCIVFIAGAVMLAGSMILMLVR